jgi:transposase
LYEASPAGTTVVDAASQGASSTPFAQAMVTITKQEYVQLKWDAQYWQTSHQRAVVREAELKAQIETLQALVRDLRQRLFGRKTEKGAARSEQQSKPPQPKRPRGQQRGSRGHGRVDFSHLPEREDVRELSDAQRCCPKCGKVAAEFEPTEDSEVIEIEVKAYRRVIRRKRYRPTCDCAYLPGIMTAPVPARLIPKGILGISVWVEILLAKYLYAQPTNRLLRSWTSLDVPLPQGTVIGGLKKLAPVFTPVARALQVRQLTEGLCHADETGWRVFEPLAGKVGYRWYLWVFRSASAMVYVMAPGRGAKVPLEYFSKLLVQTVVVCDRYAAYKKLARIVGLILAFCWAHVRRDFLTLARGYPDTEAWAMGWVQRIGTLYHLNDARVAVRDQPLSFAEADGKLRVHLAQMVAERDAQIADASLRHAARKVLVSLQNHWEGLTVFVERPETIAMDNNAAESALRNEVLGRRAYYGSGSVWAAHLAGSLFSILMTLVHCWQINPRRWLQEYLEACAEHGGHAPKDLSPFLPWLMSAERLAAMRLTGGSPTAAAAHDIVIDTS